MPLHDWSRLRNWDGLHLYWIGELGRYIKCRLPAGYRAFVGTAPAMSVVGPSGKPDVGIYRWDAPPQPPAVGTALDDGFEASVLVAEVDIGAVVRVVDEAGFLVAAVELVSPRDKDRPSERERAAARYAGYVLGGAHLMLVDVHARPNGFSFADALAAELGIARPHLPPPSAVVIRNEGPADKNGLMVAFRSALLAVGEPLPTLPLPLSLTGSVAVDLEATYSRAAADAYLD